MANNYKNIVITPNIGSATDDPRIRFSGGNNTINTDITLRVYPTSNGTLSFEGSAGQLFSITNDLSGVIFSVNDISGIPSLEIDANGRISLAQFSGNVGIGTTTPSYKLDVSGDMRVTGNVTLGDASTDTIIINGSIISLGNNQSIDSGTLFIDAVNNEVGIGTTNPTSNLHVIGSANITTVLVVGTTNVVPTIQSAFANANTTHTLTVASFNAANASFANSNTNFGTTVAAFSAANAAFANANTTHTLTISAFNKANAAFANTTGTFEGTLSVKGQISALTVGGDEGGEIRLGNAVTNSVISGPIIIDVWQNRLRFFESGGTNRGAYIDLSSANNNGGTDLLSNTSTIAAFNAANASFANGNTNFSTLQVAFGAANAAFANANTTHTLTIAAFAAANASFANGNTNFGTTVAAFSVANAGIIQANTARDQANAAFVAANVANNLTVANTGTIIGSRNILNFVPGGNVVITFADDTVGNRVNVSISAVGGGGLSYTSNVGDAIANTFNIAHNLNTTRIIPAVREISSGYYVYPDIRTTTPNHIVLEFVSIPTANQYLLILLGA